MGKGKRKKGDIGHRGFPLEIVMSDWLIRAFRESEVANTIDPTPFIEFMRGALRKLEEAGLEYEGSVQTDYDYLKAVIMVRRKGLPETLLDGALDVTFDGNEVKVDVVIDSPYLPPLK
ncbi:MAG: hypothetical protein NZ992_00035 [Candidatus Korarchaeum sp.]|nr:hypothetical protein [Candidatus Korarchaeum sp.]MDW8093355.1 hypothetical protein [Nitrososphaerota archaeon]